MSCKAGTDLAEIHQKTEAFEEYLESGLLLINEMITENPFQVLEDVEIHNFEDMIEMDYRHKVELEIRNYPYFKDRSTINEHSPRLQPFLTNIHYRNAQALSGLFSERLIARSKLFLEKTSKSYNLRGDEIIDITERLADKK